MSAGQLGRQHIAQDVHHLRRFRRHGKGGGIHFLQRMGVIRPVQDDQRLAKCGCIPRIKGGVERLVRRKTLLDDAAKATDYEGLDLIPADFSFRNFDLALGDAKKPTKQLLKLLSPINREYDLLFIDSAPSISLVSENIFYASDALIIPLIPSTLSVRTYQQLLRYFKKERSHHLKLLPFFSMYNRNRRLHRETVSNLPREFREILKTSIPDSKKVELMGEERAPVVHFAPDSGPSKAYRKLWREIHLKM